MRILVAEDDGAIIEVMHIILEGEGHEVLHAMTEKDIMALTSEKKPQLLFLDISLGADDGGKLPVGLKKFYGLLPPHHYHLSQYSDGKNCQEKRSGRIFAQAF